MKRLIAMLMVTCMVFALCSTGASAAGVKPDADGVIHLRLGSGGAADFFPNVEVQTAIDEVAERTDGKLIIDFYPNNQLGDYTDVFQEIMFGSLEMASFAAPTAYDPRLGITSLPYLITDYDKFEGLTTPGGAIFDYYADVLEDLDIVLLGMMTEGLHGIGLNKAADLSVLKDATVKKTDLVRSPPIDVTRYTVSALGYNTVTINFTDLYSSMQSGVCDGWYGGAAEVNYEMFRDVINYFVDGRYSAEILPIMINKGIFESLPEEYQQIIREAFEGAGNRSVEKCAEVEANARQKLRDYGIEVIEYTDEERAASAEYGRSIVYPEVIDVYGEDAINEIFAALAD